MKKYILQTKILAFLESLRILSVRINTLLALIVASWCFLTMFQIVGDVTGRYLFSHPIPGTYTMSGIMVVFLVFLGITYLESLHGNIRVDLLDKWLADRWGTGLELMFSMFALFMLALLTWQNFNEALQAWRVRLAALDYPIPLYPAKFAISFGFLLMFIHILINFCLKLLNLTSSKLEVE